jgi:hypothetical protein
MNVKIQFTDGTITTVDHTEFYKTIAGKDIFRFAIGTADIYNHDQYALEDMGDHLRCSMIDFSTSYPEQKWDQDDHACVIDVYTEQKWIKSWYGWGFDSTFKWTEYKMPDPSLIIPGILISDNQAQDLYNSWNPIKLSDFTKQGF